MNKVNFLIIGAQKSGTTWLVDQLRTHDGVFIPREEIHFFDKEQHYQQGIAWYHQHFTQGRSNQLLGEKTPDYLTTKCEEFQAFSNIAGRIADYSKEIKLIVILRNPVQRAISAANHMIRMGHVNPFTSLHNLVGEKRNKEALTFGVLEYGNYSFFIKKYQKVFGRKKLLILNYEQDVKKNPENGLKKVADFLGVENNFKPEILNKKSNMFNQSKPALIAKYYLPKAKIFHRVLNKFFKAKKEVPQAEDLKFLKEYYAPELERLEELGFDTSNWK